MSTVSQEQLMNIDAVQQVMDISKDLFIKKWNALYINEKGARPPRLDDTSESVDLDNAYRMFSINNLDRYDEIQSIASPPELSQFEEAYFKVERSRKLGWIAFEEYEKAQIGKIDALLGGKMLRVMSFNSRLWLENRVSIQSSVSNPTETSGIYSGFKTVGAQISVTADADSLYLLSLWHPTYEVDEPFMQAGAFEII